MTSITQESSTALALKYPASDIGISLVTALLSIGALYASDGSTTTIHGPFPAEITKSLDHSTSSKLYWADEKFLDSEPVLSFAKKLIASSEDVPEEFAKVIDDHFWELL